MNETSIFAVLDTHHRIQGTGFLVTDKLGVTCIHVVRSCKAGPGDKLLIRFAVTHTEITVYIAPESWHEQEDVVFLSIIDKIQIKAPQLRLQTEGKLNTEIRCFGYPFVSTPGLWASIEITGLILLDKGRMLIQLKSGEITSGFSGAPVWEANTGNLIGMVTAIAPEDQYGRLTQVAFAIPLSTLAALCPGLHVQFNANVNWTNEGPELSGHGLVISPSECNALLKRWFKWFPIFQKQEEQQKDSFARAMLLATIRACYETYDEVPDDDEMLELKTQLSRKFDLFYLFLQDMLTQASIKEA